MGEGYEEKIAAERNDETRIYEGICRRIENNREKMLSMMQQGKSTEKVEKTLRNQVEQYIKKRFLIAGKFTDQYLQTLDKLDWIDFQSYDWSMDKIMERAKETGGEVRYMGRNNQPWYDYSKPFAEQVDDIIDPNGNKMPQYQQPVVCGTPEVFQKIGLPSLPFTMGVGHIMGIKNAPIGDDHEFDISVLKDLPKYLSDPVAIITSNTQPSTSLVAIIEAETKTTHKKSIAAVLINGESKLNGGLYDVNVVTSFHGRSNTLSKLLYEALDNEANGKLSVYYWNKNKALNLARSSRLQLPSVMPNDGFLPSITEQSSPVKTKIISQTQTKQFERWFGDSKVVDEYGYPKPVEHRFDLDRFSDHRRDHMRDPIVDRQFRDPCINYDQPELPSNI